MCLSWFYYMEATSKLIPIHTKINLKVHFKSIYFVSFLFADTILPSESPAPAFHSSFEGFDAKVFVLLCTAKNLTIKICLKTCTPIQNHKRYRGEKKPEMKDSDNKELLAVELDADLLHEAEEVLSYLNLTSEEAIRLFYSQIILTGGLPFKLRLPKDLRKPCLPKAAAQPRTEPASVETTLPEFIHANADLVEEDEEESAPDHTFPVSEEHESHADAFMQSILDEVYDEIRRGGSE